MSGQDFLSNIVEQKRARLENARRLRPLAEVRRDAESVRRDSEPHAFRRALSDGGRVNIIAEFKRASPSKGLIRGDASAAEVARLYEAGGAAALSVLTEEDSFRGSLEDLRAAVARTSLPALRKDFVFDEYQIHEAAAAGASAVLLIVAALSDAELERLRLIAEEELGLDALVEVHTLEEMRRASHTGARLVGVNNRDLRTFEVTLETSVELAAHAPEGALLVSESGIRHASDIRRLRAHGFRAFLVGESLMRAARPDEALHELIEGQETLNPESQL
ncbi:MAG TPA: indole-3-glycerol phosphate synthase TrpC [Pyrinomonadaceae bacterium]|nr:indole-3-glycerol phosphate synthase TrpC [Pyrinomonadaceae bacterium]